MHRNEIDLSFCIWDFEDITHDKLTELVGRNPTRIYIKGEARNQNFPLRLTKANGWILESTKDKFISFENQMDFLLDILELRKEILEPICNKYYCEFSLALFINNNEESTPSVHLSSRYHDLAKELRFEFDLDLYCLQNA